MLTEAGAFRAAPAGQGRAIKGTIRFGLSRESAVTVGVEIEGVGRPRSQPSHRLHPDC